MVAFEWTILGPILLVAGLVLIVLCIDIVRPDNRGRAATYTALVGIAISLALTLRLWGSDPRHGWGGMIFLDNYALFFNLIFLVGTGLTIFVSSSYMEREGSAKSEYYLLILAATLGMMLMAAGGDLIVIFLGLELMSIALYILVGFLRRQTRSNEASLKYLLLGAFATGFLLYGIALIYGSTGSTNLREIELAVGQGRVNGQIVLLSGLALLMVGFAFKIGAVPFHMWAPDVYEGAPTAITAFMSAGPKAAAFAGFFRILFVSFRGLSDDWSGAIWVLAALTMTVGNLGALSQRNIKRMLAYSSVAHAGYVLVALAAANEKGITGGLFYLFSYTFMSIGAFAIVVVVGKRGEENLEISSYAGLGFRQPALGLAMTLFMISLAGLPPTAGFFGKFYIFSGAIESSLVGLTIIGVLNSLVSVYFYLGVVVSMYMRQPVGEVYVFSLTPFTRAALAVTSLATLYIGLAPSRFLQMARESVSSLL
ncbi:MAG: NADH-quinone oxidoreductase subunit N [Candidatus Latescibacterota bacterium]|nr:NADH-quinone oxidoreductase subunit N [Candidatus Latescibacterota bacterium]